MDKMTIQCTNSQFGFMPVMRTTDGIFTQKHTIEKHREGQTNIRVIFIDLEKTFDRKDVRKNVLGSMMYAYYAYDIVQCGDDETDMTEYSETWMRALENRWMRFSRAKIQSIGFKFGQERKRAVKILGDELHRVHHFKYIGSSAEETGGMAT